jgi:hypothetical protein
MAVRVTDEGESKCHSVMDVDGKKVGEGNVRATAAMVFSADDGCDVGVS